MCFIINFSPVMSIINIWRVKWWVRWALYWGNSIMIWSVLARSSKILTVWVMVLRMGMNISRAELFWLILPGSSIKRHIFWYLSNLYDTIEGSLLNYSLMNLKYFELLEQNYFLMFWLISFAGNLWLYVCQPILLNR